MLDISGIKNSKVLKISSKILSIFIKKIPLFTISFFVLLALTLNLSIKTEQQFWFLADSFMHGKLYLMQIPGSSWLDSAFHNGHYYWVLGPFPAVVMIPFVFLSKTLSTFLNQGIPQILATLGIILLCFKIARIYKFSKEHSLLLGFAFCFSSVYVIVAFLPWGWYFTQAITVFLLFSSIYEYLTKKRYWLIGILFGLILATRFTAGIGIIFFIADLLIGKAQLGNKMKSLLALLIPCLIIGIILLLYNQMRFGNMLDNGYLKANNVLLSKQDRFEALNYGLFQLRNVPSNFYYYFIKSLDPVVLDVKSLHGNTYILKFPYITVNYPGTSFFIVSPIFLFLLKTKFRDKLVRISFMTMLVILFLILSYYWSGWRQVGPRYMLDLLPFAYIPLLLSFKNSKLPVKAQALILLSAVFNLYLFFSVLGK